MHLSEELGEATIELSRLELAWRGISQGYDVKAALNKAVKYGPAKIDREITRMAGASAEEIKEREERLRQSFEDERKAFNERGVWDVFRERVSEKFKEEVSDVFSWLAGVLLKLEPGRTAIHDLRKKYLKMEGGGSEFLMCHWCGMTMCDNGCLVSHGLLSEIMEKITKY
jgi:hypothetical protein